MTTGTRTRRRGSGDNDLTTPLRLMEAARIVFARLGCNDANVEDIIREAGVSRGAFYLYFKNKNAIFEALVTRVIDDMFERAGARRGGGSMFANLERGNRAFLEVWARDGDLLRNLQQLAMLDPHFEAMHSSMRQRFIDRSCRAIARHKDEGITHDIDPRVAASALAAMVETFAIRHFTHGEPADVTSDLRTFSFELSALWYRAVYTDAAPPVPDREQYFACDDLLQRHLECMVEMDAVSEK